MINIIEELMKDFEVLNNSINKKMFSKKVLAEAYDNINDFKKIQPDMSDLFNQLSNVNSHDEDKINIVLAHLHFQVSNVVWHFGEIRELIEIIMGRYRKLIQDQDIAKD